MELKLLFIQNLIKIKISPAKSGVGGAARLNTLSENLELRLALKKLYFWKIQRTKNIKKKNVLST